MFDLYARSVYRSKATKLTYALWFAMELTKLTLGQQDQMSDEK